MFVQYSGKKLSSAPRDEGGRSDDAAGSAQDRFDLLAAPGVADLLAQIEAAAAKGEPVAEGATVSVYILYDAHLRSMQVDPSISIELFECIRAQTDVGPSPSPSSAEIFNRLLAAEQSGTSSPQPDEKAEPSKLPVRLAKEIGTTAFLILQVLAALITILTLDLNIFGAAIELMFPPVRGQASPIATPWLMAIMIPLAAAGYIKMKRANSRLHRIVDKLSSMAIVVALIAAGVFVATSVIGAFDSQGFTPPPELGDDAALPTWTIASFLSALGHIGLGLVLAAVTIISFFAIHGLLIRWREQSELLVDYVDQLLAVRRERKELKGEIVARKEFDLIEERLAIAPHYVAARIHAAVHPAITAHKNALRNTRLSGIPKSNLAVLEAHVDRLERDSRPEILLSYILRALTEGGTTER